MWLLICVFFCALFISSHAEYVEFRKCCPENQSLIREQQNFGDRDEFLCVDNESAKLNYNITKLPRIVVLEGVSARVGIPSNCTDIRVIASNKQDLKSTDDVCFDKMVAEILNGTTQLVPKTVALICNESDNNTKAKLEINHIRKCCPEGQAYDTQHHKCRDVLYKTTAAGLLKWLHVKPESVYDMDIELRCKTEEYAIELVEGEYTITLNGSVLEVFGSKGGGRVPSGEWCVDSEFSYPRLMARVCTTDCGQYGAFCFRKCCPLGHHFKLTGPCSSLRSVCVPDDDALLFETDSYLEDLRNNYDGVVDVIGLGISIKCQFGKFGLNRSEDNDVHWITWDGKLIGKKIEYNMSMYCLETFDFRDCPQQRLEVTALACFVPDPEKTNKNFQFAAVTNTLSATFLLITVIVYCCIPELQNLHGRTVICHASTMLMAYTCLARVQFDRVFDKTLCMFLGYGIYFGFVAAFFWLNVMCFDIWWTFGSMHTVQTMRKASTERKRFLWYSLYAWGVTFLLTLVMYLFDVYHVSDLLDANMGKSHCWFSSVQNVNTDWPHYIFFVVPMGVITSLNLTLWILTARHCARVKSEVHRMQSGSVGDRAKKRFRIDRAKYLLTGKLWVVMGAGWISELISTLITEPIWLWSVVDLINQLQGIFIFLLLVFKPKIYYLIKKRLGLVKPDDKIGTSSGRTSSTFLSRTISNDERTNLRTSLPSSNGVKRA